jgi:uncharacterized protein YkuJ
MPYNLNLIDSQNFLTLSHIIVEEKAKYFVKAKAVLIIMHVYKPSKSILMKRTFTLILATLIALSVMGQHAYEKARINTRDIKKNSEFFHGISARNSEDEIHKYRPHKISKATRLNVETTAKQKLDSIIYDTWDELTSQWIEEEKDIYTYDVNGNVILYVYYYRDEITSQWMGGDKEEYTYDANGNMSYYIDYDWDEYASQWFDPYKSLYSYDANGNITSETGYYWDELASQWLPASKDEYSFDINGNEILYIGSEWYESTSQWVGSYKVAHNYDADGNMTLELEYYWDESTSQWIPQSRGEYSYDGSGNKTMFLQFYWDSYTNHWYNQSKNEYSYDVNGNVTLRISSNWDESTSQWIPSYKDANAYNANDRLTLSISYYWDGSASQWIGTEKEACTYNENGDMILDIYYSWDESTSQWIGEYKQELTFNNSFSMADLILPFYYDLDVDEMAYFTHMPTQATWFDYTGTSWIPDDRMSIYFSAFYPSGIADHSEADDVLLFPNPASDYVKFVCDGAAGNIYIEFFDIRGRKVLRCLAGNNESISVEGLVKGMYFYTVDDNGCRYKGKLVIK